jgi:hypothetical protein
MKISNFRHKGISKMQAVEKTVLINIRKLRQFLCLLMNEGIKGENIAVVWICLKNGVQGKRH